ncbi:hypothetical protein EWB00_008731 [Schistosoma japonicum]|uniref:Uncharacterized protein n=1 Tax=Schistosoma japonicum TaxID=6182 RepID=A0A4Z2DSI2_SCHJA|nr:hypothetical protein EWB00_008731 [Schistosoma japonicum]
MVISDCSKLRFITNLDDIEQMNSRTLSTYLNLKPQVGYMVLKLQGRFLGVSAMNGQSRSNPVQLVKPYESSYEVQKYLRQ